MKISVFRCISEVCRTVFAIEAKEDVDTTDASCPICNDKYYVLDFGSGSIIFEKED